MVRSVWWIRYIRSSETTAGLKRPLQQGLLTSLPNNSLFSVYLHIPPGYRFSTDSIFVGYELSERVQVHWAHYSVVRRANLLTQVLLCMLSLNSTHTWSPVMQRRLKPRSSLSRRPLKMQPITTCFAFGELHTYLSATSHIPATFVRDEKPHPRVRSKRHLWWRKSFYQTVTSLHFISIPRY
jgi:hypothetical protein